MIREFLVTVTYSVSADTPERAIEGVLDGVVERTSVVALDDDADAPSELVALLGPGASFWHAPGNATGATNHVVARDAMGIVHGIGQTEHQALADAAHRKSEL